MPPFAHENPAAAGLVTAAGLLEPEPRIERDILAHRLGRI